MGYSVQSGVFGAVDERVNVAMNRYGQYEANFSHDGREDGILEALAEVSAMSRADVNEDVMAQKLFGDVRGIKHGFLVGYNLQIYAGFVTEGQYRENASSGGLTSWLLVQLLQRGLIDGVIHVTEAGPEEGDVLFQYSISRTEEAVRQGAKSRYYPADLSEVLRIAKKAGGRYALTGIPSFISEVRLLREVDPAFKDAIAYTLGLICGHQKSTKYAEAMAWEHGVKPGDLVSVDFRKKVPGARADEYITEFVGLIDGEQVTFTKSARDVFVGSWSQGFFKAKFSDFTDDLFNETADVTLGDAWLPQYSGDSRGTNLVIVRNPDIAAIIADGLSTGALKLDVLSSEQAVQSQAGLVRHSYDELPYRLAREDRRGRWRPIKRVVADGNLPSLRKRIQDIREEISQQSHVHYAKAVELGEWDYFYRQMKPLVDRHNALYGISDARRILKKGPLFLLRKALGELRRRRKKS